MSASRIHLYIAREILSPTLLCLLIFTMVLLMGRLMRLVDLVINKGVSVTDIMILFGTMLPTFLSITLPLAFLMGIMVGLSRMAADNETIALKSAGIGLAQISRPVLVLALVFSILTGIAGFWLKPLGYEAFRNHLFAITMQKATIGIQPQVFMTQFNNLMLYTDDIDNRSGQMNGLFIVEKKPEATMMIFADRGHIVSDKDAETISFRLQDGTIHRQENEDDTSYQLIHFRNYNVQPDLSDEGDKKSQVSGQRKNPKKMSTAALWKFTDNTNIEDSNQRLHAKSELHSRLVSPMAPFLFALFGLPFSIQSHRSGRSGGFVVGLIIYLCYYVMLSLAKTLTADAGMMPWLTFWAPHIILTLFGLYLLNQSAHEQPNPAITWLEERIETLKSRLKRFNEHS